LRRGSIYRLGISPYYTHQQASIISLITSPGSGRKIYSLKLAVLAGLRSWAYEIFGKNRTIMGREKKIISL
jgi:hypothetical protein